MRGVVIRNTGSWYDVRTDSNQLFACKVKGNFRLRGIRSTNPVAVGDVVEICSNEDGTALISEIVDRRNYIIRKASNLSAQSHIIAANVDVACLIVTLSHPETSLNFVDRFIASAEAYRVPVLLVFNKLDLYSEKEKKYLAAVVRLYTTVGYSCVTLSAETGEGVDKLLETLQGKTCLFSGNSGVGKSTLLNRIIPSAHAKTLQLSEAHDQGQHATTFSEMYDLPQGGYIIDTPGIRGFGTFDFEREEVSHYFREIFKIGQSCRFSNCTHTHEPGCAVQKALGNHEISESRYHSYLSMLDDKDEGKYR